MSTFERLEKLSVAISKSSFLLAKGLGNEIGYYIFDYPPEDELLIRDWIRFKVEQGEQGLLSYGVCNIDLYESMVKILELKGYLDKTFQKEKLRGTSNLVTPITTTLRLNSKDENTKNLIIDNILVKIKENDILFISGTGKVWPIISSHSILNKLHQFVDKNPVILFFPGKYSKEDLKLFGYIGGDGDSNYYRAFKIVD